MSRLFIGCPIDSDSSELIARALSPWQTKQQQVQWLQRDNWHMTLAFVGEVEDSIERELAMSMATDLSDQQCLAVSLLNLSAFPDAHSEILVAQVMASPALETLHHICTNLCANLSVPQHSGKYRPHITLAHNARSLLPRLLPLKLSGHLDIRQVALYRSEVIDNKRSYRIIHQCALRQVRPTKHNC